MNPYQRIVLTGKEIQPGHIDTIEKFAQLTYRIDIEGKTVLDVGCNLGMMCHLAVNAGASAVKGVDIDRQYIKEAKQLFPYLPVDVCPAHRISGNWDIIIASAMSHYVVDLDAMLRQFARCGSLVLMDVWLEGYAGEPPRLHMTERGLSVPNMQYFEHFAKKYFKTVKQQGTTLSPDKSHRYIYHLSNPKKTQAEAVLIYGDGGAGKTTLAKTYFNHDMLQTDQIFVEWRIVNIQAVMSAMWHMQAARGEQYDAYMNFRADYFNKWLTARENIDVVIEGYELTDPKIRAGLEELLTEKNWKIKHIEL